MINKPGIKILFFIIIILSAKSLFSQSKYSDSEVKASLILRFSENVIWKNNEPQIFNIACICNDNNVYNLLKQAQEKVKIKEKNFTVKSISENQDITQYNIIYYAKSDDDKLINIFNICRSNNILLITDNIDNELFIVINIVAEQNRLGFKVNMANLNLSGFETKPSLLLNGGSIVDINKAYEKFEARIENSKKALLETDNKLKQSELVLKIKDSMLLQREKKLAEYTNEVEKRIKESDLLKADIVKEREKIELQRNELLKLTTDIDKLLSDIRIKELEYTVASTNLDKLKIESEELKEEIANKNILVERQDAKISIQQKRLLLSFALVITLIVAVSAFIRLFSLKKQHSILLEQKVDEKTKELQILNAQYLSLFNLSPIAQWETDFTEVVKYISAKGLKSESHFNEYVENNPDFIRECLQHIKYVRVNEAALKLHEVSDNNSLKELIDKMPNKEVQIVINEFKKLFKGEQFSSYETINTAASGKILELIVTWADVSDIPKTYSRVLMSLTDITHLRKVERELKRHQSELEQLVAEQTREIINTNEELKLKNEEINIKNRDLNKAINELKDTQAQLLQSEKMASLGVLTAGVAHEINNPLNYISGAYEGLKNLYASHNNENLNFMLSAIKTGVDRAAAIVKSLNQFSRDSQTINEECNIHTVLDNCLTMLHNQLKHKVKIINNYSAQKAVLQGNVGNLHQVFLNILTNAEQAIAEKGTITIATINADNNIVVKISDSGSGIEQSILDKITDPFFTTKDPGKGTGLGLSITYKIIKEHNGALSFESQVGKGTTTIVELPV